MDNFDRFGRKHGVKGSAVLAIVVSNEMSEPLLLFRQAPDKLARLLVEGPLAFDELAVPPDEGIGAEYQAQLLQLASGSLTIGRSSSTKVSSSNLSVWVIVGPSLLPEQ